MATPIFLTSSPNIPVPFTLYPSLMFLKHTIKFIPCQALSSYCSCHQECSSPGPHRHITEVSDQMLLPQSQLPSLLYQKQPRITGYLFTPHPLALFYSSLSHIVLDLFVYCLSLLVEYISFHSNIPSTLNSTWKITGT